jgi:microcystin-dependent protein
MPIKLGNNAIARLAAPLAIDGTTIVLVEAESGSFPALGAGDWFPMTLSDSAGHLEIVKVTARSANILTAVRAQEASSAFAFDSGDRAEIRLTAGVINQLQVDTAAAVTQAASDLAATTSTLRGETDVAIDALEAQTASNLAVALGALVPTGFGPIPWSRPTAPAGWIFADGRTLLAASPYAALRAAYIADSFPFGQDGSGNPKIPDMRGRTAAGLDNMGGGAASRLTGATLGAGLGAQTHTLTAAEMPVHAHGVTDPTHAHAVADPTHAHSVYDPGHSHTYDRYSAIAPAVHQSGTNQSRNSQTIATGASATGIGIYAAATGISIYGAGTGISIQNAGSGGAHNNVQPTLVTNFIIKV